jgi:hypothetical protein
MRDVDVKSVQNSKKGVFQNRGIGIIKAKTLHGGKGVEIGAGYQGAVEERRGRENWEAVFSNC